MPINLCLYFLLLISLYSFKIVIAEPDVIRVPADYPTIKQALDAATPGDTIIVSEEVYAEGEIWITKSNLTLMTEGNVVVDGKGEARWVFYVQGAKNVTIEGFTVNNSSPGYQYAGICLDHAHNCTISNNTATNNGYNGIFLYYSSHNTIADNVASFNEGYGIDLHTSPNNNLTNNLASYNFYNGLYIAASYNNTLTHNMVTHNHYSGISVVDSNGNVLIGNVAINNTGSGISLEGSGASILSGNKMTGNRYNLYAGGDLRGNEIDSSNLVDGKRVYYLKNQHDLTIDPSTFADLGYLAVINSTRVVVSNVTVTKNGVGVLFAYVTDSTIENVNITRNEVGIDLVSSHRNAVRGCDVTANTLWGIDLDSANFNDFTQNTVTHNYMGFVLGGDFNLFSDNVVADCDNGIYMGAHADNNTIHRNFVANNTNDWGGGIAIISSDNTTVTENTMVNNYWGVFLVASTGNFIYHNNFIDNVGATFSGESQNAWDDGYPSGGNYWSDYNGTDAYRGPYQDMVGSDGIGDTPFIPENIAVNPENITDRYPLTKPYGGPHDLGILGSVSRKTIIGEGYYTTVSMNLTIINYGIETENFNLTIHTGTAVQNQTLSLASRNSTTLILTFDTTGLEIGIYSLGAYAEPVQGETYMADNNCTTPIIITVPGDADGDFGVDLYDAVKLLVRYGSEEPDPLYDPNCDIDNDGEIFLYDAVILLTHYGQKYP